MRPGTVDAVGPEVDPDRAKDVLPVYRGGGYRDLESTKGGPLKGYELNAQVQFKMLPGFLAGGLIGSGLLLFSATANARPTMPPYEAPTAARPPG